jgi:predicted RNase H-like nuclease
VTSVLGIDAAWTRSKPTGVALVSGEPHGAWSVVKVAASYSDFVTQSGSSVVFNSEDPAPGLLSAARAYAPLSPVRIVAVDMPLSHGPITCRRVADQETSRQFGAYCCAVHSPLPHRPGPVAEELRDSFSRSGLSLQVDYPVSASALLEVYPHAALVRLLGLQKRHAYKVARKRKYWPSASPAERNALLVGAFGEILQRAVHWFGPLDGKCPKRLRRNAS